GPGLGRQGSLRPLRLPSGQDRLADLDHRRREAVAAQGCDHESYRRSPSPVGFHDQLEPEAQLRGLDLRVHTAHRGEEDRDRRAQRKVEDLAMKTSFGRLVLASSVAVALTSLIMSDVAQAQRRGGGGGGQAAARGGGGGAQVNNSRADARSGDVRSTSVNNVN